ncbi:hypothetical protein Btru_035408 [Bulinus truncatus]|nr:hypothetical protein Btru_035408 [Bulinus truncatus]
MEIDSDFAMAIVLMRSQDTRSKSKHCENLVIRGINSDIFALVLDAIFKGENKISDTNVIEMWYAAHHLQINFLIQKCETFIVDHMTVINYLHFYPHAAKLKSETVLDNIREIMVMNFDDFRQTETFLKLPVDHLVAVVKSEGFSSYDSVAESILQWVEYEEVSDADAQLPKPGDKNKDCHQEKNTLIEVEQVRSIEVLFNNENLILEKSVDRKELVGRIMTNVNLGLVGKEGIKILIHNDLVMDNRDARSIVCKALSAQVELDKVAICCSVTNAITDVVVAGSTSMEVNNPVHTNSLPPADSVSSDISNLHGITFFETSHSGDNLQHVFIFLDVNKKLVAYNIVTNQFFFLR